MTIYKVTTNAIFAWEFWLTLAQHLVFLIKVVSFLRLVIEKVWRVGVAVGSEKIFGEDALFDKLPEENALKITLMIILGGI